MKEPYIKGEAAPLWPRVMRRLSARRRRSVDRGSVGQPLSSEITSSGVPTTWSGREGKTESGANQLAAYRPRGVFKNLCMRGRSQPNARDTIAEYQRALLPKRIYDKFAGLCNPNEQAMLSLICEKLSFVRNQVFLCAESKQALYTRLCPAHHLQTRVEIR